MRTLPHLGEFYATTTSAATALVLTGATWNVNGAGRAYNTPTLGSDIAVNGTFDADATWAKGTGWTIAAGVATKASGSQSQLTQGIYTAGTWYRMTWDLVWSAGTFAAVAGTGTLGENRSASGSYIATLRAGNTQCGVRGTSTNSAGSVDNIKAYAITKSTLFSTLTYAAQCDVAANLYDVAIGTQIGIVSCLDSAGTPANFVRAYWKGNSTIGLEKVVGGTVTSLIETAGVFVQGGLLEIRWTGATTVQLWYNGSQVGANQTVSDAGIVSNTLHGVFSTDDRNVFSSFYVDNLAGAFAYTVSVPP